MADVAKIKDVLGYKPVMSFEDGLKKAVDWFRGSTVNGHSPQTKNKP